MEMVPQTQLFLYTGGLPTNFDDTPKNVGLMFGWAPNSKDILLIEAQAPIASAGLHLASSMYSDGQLKRGFNQVLTPLLHDKENAVVLLDMTQWIFSFARYAQVGGIMMSPSIRLNLVLSL